MLQHKTIPAIIRSNPSRRVEDFSSEGKALFGLLTLIVDIQYRELYAKSFDYINSLDYIEGVNTKNVLADKIPPVDNGLLGH